MIFRKPAAGADSHAAGKEEEDEDIWKTERCVPNPVILPALGITKYNISLQSSYISHPQIRYAHTRTISLPNSELSGQCVYYPTEDEQTSLVASAAQSSIVDHSPGKIGMKLF